MRSPPDGLDADWAAVRPALQQALVAAINAGRFPVYMFGEQGRGKTCAIAALYRKVDPTPTWLDLQQFIRAVQRTRTSDEGRSYAFSENGHSEYELWKRFVEVPKLLLVDDVAIRSPSDSAYEIVYELVNRRGRRPAIYTSNVGPDKLHEVYDGRVASRMLCGSIIRVTGEDRRIAGVQIIEA